MVVVFRILLLRRLLLLLLLCVVFLMIHRLKLREQFQVVHIVVYITPGTRWCSC